MQLTDALTYSVVAGLIASLACGLGILPLMWPKLDPKGFQGLGYAFAGGLMFAASVYNLIEPGLKMDAGSFDGPGGPGGLGGVGFTALKMVGGILLGALFLSAVDRWLSGKISHHRVLTGIGGRASVLIFVAMTVHSFPEGVAVGVGFASGRADANPAMGMMIALAIAIHNIPEGLAVAIPLRAGGASFNKCFWMAVLTSLPQPLAAIPAVLLGWSVEPVIPILMGFAAGAMIFLILLELIPQALKLAGPKPIAWSFLMGFCLMVLVQIAL